MESKELGRGSRCGERPILRFAEPSDSLYRLIVLVRLWFEYGSN